VEHDEIAEELQRLRERAYEFAGFLHEAIARVAVLEGRLQVMTDRVKEISTTTVTRPEMEHVRALAEAATPKAEMTALLERVKDFITRAEFTPVQRIVYGLAASIMGAFIMAVAMMVLRAKP
jgi:hypothetical protein